MVRFLVEDDQQQTQQAKQFIADAIAKEETLFLSDIVLAETVWVLARSYRLSRKEITTALRQFLVAQHLVFSSSAMLVRAVTAYENGKADFADYLIREQALNAGCEKIATFDQALLKEEGFIELP